METLVGRVSTRIPAYKEWDDFAQRCGGTYLCAHGYLSAMRLMHKLKIFEFFIGETKVGQCAVAKRRIGIQAHIVDMIQLLPNYRTQWADAIRIVIRALGHGRYRYGSFWSVDPPREADLRNIDGVTLLGSESFQVQIVDFSAWPDWEAYYRAMSSNAKRNAAKAVRNDPVVRFEYATGWCVFRYGFQMLLRGRNLYARKGMGSHFFLWSIRFLRRLVLLRRYIFVARVFYHGRLTAFVSGVQFGEHTYYLDGASVGENGGSAWYLFVELLHTLWSTCPTGKFVMGADRPDFGSRWVGWNDVQRQRQQCRVVEFPTSIVAFQYH